MEDRKLTEDEFKAMQEQQRQADEATMYEEACEGRTAIEAVQLLRDSFNTRAAGAASISRSACAALLEELPASEGSMAKALDAACTSLPGEATELTLPQLVQLLVDSDHLASLKYSVVEKAHIRAVFDGKKPLARRTGFLSKNDNFTKLEEVQMTLKEALEYCYNNDQCKAVCTFNSLLKKAETQKVRMWRGQFTRVTQGVGAWTTWSSFYKVPETCKPKGLSHRMNSKEQIRSHYFCQLLIDNGWHREIDRDAPAMFMYLNPPWNNPSPMVRFCNFPLSTTKKIDDKRVFWTTLLNAGQDEWTPKTYLDLQSFKSDESQVEQQTGSMAIFFLKDAKAVHQQGVWCCKGVAEVEAKVAEIAAEKKKSSADLMKGYCIQRGIDQMYLLDGKKFNMRVYAVVVNHVETGLKVYLFESVHLRVFNVNHEQGSTDAKMQIGIDGHTFQCYASELPCWERVLPKIREGVSSVCRSFAWERARQSTIAEFALLGFDFLVDSEERAWCIEVNDWPCIEWKETERGSHTSQFK